MVWNRKQPKTYYDIKECRKRISIHQGGSSSGKTWSILNTLIEIAFKNRNNNNKKGVISVVRKTLSAIKKSVYRDFKNILESEKIPFLENRTELIINLFGTSFEFMGLDDPQKARGPRRDILYCNEANELTYEDFVQLNMRTRVKTIIDFNPSGEFWAHTELQGRDDVGFYKSNYKHNPFLDPSIRAEIERFKEKDVNYWRIYGLGELGFLQGLVYPSWQQIKEIPENVKNLYYGLDFGFSNSPTALILAGIEGDSIFMQEIIYEKGKLTKELIEMFNSLKLNKNIPIIADNARPEAIEEIYRAGYNIHPCRKIKVIDGIHIVKGYNLYATSDSINLIKELRNYKYMEDKTGKILNEPVKDFDHGLDAVRYILTNNIQQPKIRTL